MAENALGNLFNVVMGIAPLDLQTARNGDWVFVGNCGHVTILLIKGQGTAGDDPTLTLQEAKTAAGGNSQALAQISESWQQEENAANLEATVAWTRVTQTIASTLAADATSAESAMLIAIELDTAKLSDGYDWIRVNVGDVGTNAQLGALIYIPSELRYGGKPQNQPSFIS